MVIKWLGRMLDRESAAHDSRRFQTRLRAAKPRESGACMEDVDYRARASWTARCSESSGMAPGSPDTAAS
jgi:hypothetical protein